MINAFKVVETNTVHISPAGILSYAVQCTPRPPKTTFTENQEYHAYVHKNALTHTLNAVRNCCFSSLSECSRD